MDWTTWQPRERAILCFILNGDRVLLIRKKRGLGAGKINGPGGKIEPGETAEQAAVRETQEEIGVTPLGLQECGHLSFQFTDGYSLRCAVFIARHHDGEPIETVEATPFWCGVSKIPYEEMWADDQYWLPRLLAGEKFEGWFEFDGDKMLSQEVRWL